MNKEQFLSMAHYSRKFTPEDIFFTEAGMQYPDLRQAALDLVEGGETAWGVPEFESAVFGFLNEWMHEGKYLRVHFYAGWLTPTVEGSTKAKLQDYADGFYFPYLGNFAVVRNVIGTTTDHLYPLNLNRLVQAQLRAIERGCRMTGGLEERDPLEEFA